MARACNPSSQEAEAGGLLPIPAQPGLHCEYQVYEKIRRRVKEGGRREFPNKKSRKENAVYDYSEDSRGAPTI